MRRLSPRQTEILILREAGLTERQIADALGLQYGTVQAYSRHLHASGFLPGRGDKTPRRLTGLTEPVHGPGYAAASPEHRRARYV